MKTIKISKPKCIRCGKKMQIARTESKLKEGLIVCYCYNEKHRKIKIRIITKQGIRRAIRNDRMKMTSEYEQEFNMKNLKCVCGHRLQFDRFGSYQAAGKILGNCFNNPVHRITLQIVGKLLKDEPTCEEFFEIFITPYTV